LTHSLASAKSVRDALPLMISRVQMFMFAFEFGPRRLKCGGLWSSA
jgi:hypothetical protein